jgi:hypothetical protein
MIGVRRRRRGRKSGGEFDEAATLGVRVGSGTGVTRFSFEIGFGAAVFGLCILRSLSYESGEDISRLRY